MSYLIFRDPSLSIDARVNDLISRMSLTEKINQLACINVSSTKLSSDVQDGIGEVALVALEYFPTLKEFTNSIKALQEEIIQSSPNGIPALFHIEALCGPQLPNAVSFPSPINLGATFSPEDIHDMANRTREQLVCLGIRQALSPVMDLIRDFRWGRTNELYSSDPTLVSAMACAYVDGLQGKDLKVGVAATGKHFLGYSQTEGGLNMSKVLCDKQELRESFAKPFEASIRVSNIKSIMTAYSSLNGIPICSSKSVLTDLLRNDLGFDGLIVSDYMSLQRLLDPFKITDNATDAALQCLEAGLDVELPERYGYGNNLIEAVKMGSIDESVINRSVERILKLKFELGLFENPFPTLMEDNFDNEENNRRSLEVTRKSITLTKNEGLLPIKNKQAKIAVIGPSGNNVRVMFGSYMFGCAIEMGYLIKKTVFDAYMAVVDQSYEKTKFMNGAENDSAFRNEINTMISRAYPEAKSIFEALNENFESITYTTGCDIKDDTDYDFEAAVMTAQKADIVIMAVGSKNGWGKHCTDGEGVDSTYIELFGRQDELIKKVFAANPNMVVVHIGNKPLVNKFVYDNVPAILEAWIPGVYGGQSIADVLTGNYNPGGRLTVDVPHSAGQLPMYHYQYNGNRRSDDLPSMMTFNGYVNESSTPLRPFGFGLTYTHFEYFDFKLSSSKETDIPILSVSVSIRNMGDVAGDEVLQLYGKDILASVIRPTQELIGFKRISLQPQESKIVVFTFRLDQMAFINSFDEWVIEKGDFAFFIGKNSLDIQFEEIYTQKQTIKIDHRNRGFFANAIVMNERS